MENIRYFQWLVGEKKNDIHIFDHVERDDDINYICFKDGARINEEYVVPLNHPDATGKIMAEIDHPDNNWKFKEEWVGHQEERWELNEAQERVCVDPYIEGIKKIILIPPKKSAPRTSNFGNVIETKPQPQPQPQPQYQQVELTSNINQNDPVYILMDKSKKVTGDINMLLSIALPSKSLYNLAKDSFDEGDKKVIEYIIENISVKEIKEAIKVALTDMYEQQEDGFVENK